MRDKERRIPNAVLGSILILLGCTLGYVTISYVVDAVRVRSWVEVPCHIMHSAVSEVAGTRTKYRFEVRYVYSWEGKQYESDTCTLGETESGSPKWPKELKDRFRVGDTTVCYVNPHKPKTEAVLERGSLGVVFTALALIVPFVLGARLIVGSLRPDGRPISWSVPTTIGKSGAEKGLAARILILAWRGLLVWAIILAGIMFVAYTWIALGLLIFVGGVCLLFPYMLSGAAVGAYNSIRQHLRKSFPEGQGESVKRPGPLKWGIGKIRVLTAMEKVVIAIAAVLYTAFITYRTWYLSRGEDISTMLIVWALFMAVFFLGLWTFPVLVAITVMRRVRTRARAIPMTPSQGVPKAARIAKRFASALFLCCAVINLIGGVGLMETAYLVPMHTMSQVRFPLCDTDDVAVGSSGRIYCTIGHPSRVQVYTHQGEFVQGWFIPTAGAFRLKMDSDDRLHVVTARGNDHYVFDAEGHLFSERKITFSQKQALFAGKRQGKAEDAQGNRYRTRGSVLLSRRVVKILPDHSRQTVVSDPWYLRPLNPLMIGLVAIVSLIGWLILLKAFPSRADAEERRTERIIES